MRHFKIHYSCMRDPKSTQEKRANQDCEYVRAKRRPCHLPDAWDDIWVRGRRTWKDNRIENLRFICPNCHSQQKTSKNKKRKYYCKCGNLKGKKSNLCGDCAATQPRLDKRKVNRPSLEVLLQDVKDLGYCGTGRKYGVSDNAVRKWIKAYNKPG